MLMEKKNRNVRFVYRIKADRYKTRVDENRNGMSLIAEDNTEVEQEFSFTLHFLIATLESNIFDTYVKEGDLQGCARLLIFNTMTRKIPQNMHYSIQEMKMVEIEILDE